MSIFSQPGRRRAMLAALCAASLAAPGLASAASVRAEYGVSVRGFPVGSAQLKAHLGADGSYAAEFAGRVRGIMRLFSDGRAAAQASGQEQGEALRPSQYQHRWTEDDETEIVQMQIAGGRVSEVSVDPPPRNPERYVPVTDAHRANVVDPVSAFVWPAPDGLQPELCERTLPLFDGQMRYDLDLSFSRSETLDSQSGAAIVCAIRYRPISGHRPNKESVRFMAENEEMEVWMAEAAGSGVAIPVHIRILTSHGRVVLEARELEAD